MTDVSLAADPAGLAALQARLSALEALRAGSTNINENGRLDGAISEVAAAIAGN